MTSIREVPAPAADAREGFVAQSLRLLHYHRRSIWWITSRVLLVGVVWTAVCLGFFPKYVARAKMTLLPSGSEIGYAQARLEAWADSPAATLAQTQSEILLSRTLAEAVAQVWQEERTGDAKAPGIGDRLQRMLIAPIAGARSLLAVVNTGRWAMPDPFTALVQTIQARTRVENIPGSLVFQVRVEWDNAESAARLANLITERYVAQSLNTSQEEMRIAREFIDARIRETGLELLGIQRHIQAYRSEAGLYVPATDLQLALEELSGSVRDLHTTSIEGQQLDARIASLRAYQSPAALATIEADRAGLKTRQEAIGRVIREQSNRLDEMPGKEAGLLDLYRERTNRERALGTLQDRLLDTKIAEASQLGTARVIDAAVPPLLPEQPRLLRGAVGSLLLGLLLSGVFVLASESPRASIRSPSDLGAAVEGLLSVMPFAPETSATDDPDEAKTGRFAEFFRRMLHGPYGTVAHQRMVKRHTEGLLVQMVERGRGRVWLFLSANGGEGKTSVVRRLAHLATDAGRKVLLVDGHFARPRLQELLAPKKAPGLAELLTSATLPLADVTRAIDAGVDLIGASANGVSAAARWDTARVREDLRALAADYDLILIDGGALHRDPSTARLTPLADEVVCVVDATASRAGDLEVVRESLGARAAGLSVLSNKVQYKPDYQFAG